MPNYQKTRIYKLYDKVTLKYVIGGTAVEQLSKIKYDDSKSKRPVFDDYTNVRVIEIAKTPCDTKQELKDLVDLVITGKDRDLRIGYIYKLYDGRTRQYYIGSTTDYLPDRISSHKHARETAPISSTYKIMRAWEDFKYKIIDICHPNYTKKLEDRYIRMHYDNELNINAIPSTTNGWKDRLKRKTLKSDIATAASAPLPDNVEAHINRLKDRRKEVLKAKPFVICSYCGGSWRKGRKDHEQGHLISDKHLAAVTLRPKIPIRINTLDSSIGHTDTITCTICLGNYNNVPSMIRNHNLSDKHTKVLKALIHHGLIDPKDEQPSTNFSKSSIICQDCGGTYTKGGQARHNARDSHKEMANRDLSLVKINGLDPTKGYKDSITCMVCLGSFINGPKSLEQHRKNVRHKRILDIYVSRGILPDYDIDNNDSIVVDNYEFTELDASY